MGKRMTTNGTSPPTKNNFWSRINLRTRLFMASALLSTLILLVAAAVINNLVVRQARQQVQSEVENLLPVYNAIWEEKARSLAAVGTTMANAPKCLYRSENRAEQQHAHLIQTRHYVLRHHPRPWPHR